METQLSGVGVPSSTVLDGRFAIRICITNHRTSDADLDAIVSYIRVRGAELATAARSTASAGSHAPRDCDTDTSADTEITQSAGGNLLQ